MKSTFKIFMTAATLFLAALTLFLFFTMDQARAEVTPVESPLGFNHFGAGRLNSTEELSFDGAYERVKTVTVATGAEISVEFDRNGRIVLSTDGRKIPMSAQRMLRTKVEGNQSTYMLRGSDMIPPQRYNIEIKIQHEAAAPIGEARFARRSQCLLGGRYYQVINKESRIQNAEVRILNPDSNQAIAQVATRRTHVTRELPGQTTSCSAQPVNPLRTTEPAIIPTAAEETRPAAEETRPAAPVIPPWQTETTREWQTTISR